MCYRTRISLILKHKHDSRGPREFRSNKMKTFSRNRRLVFRGRVAHASACGKVTNQWKKKQLIKFLVIYNEHKLC